MTDDASEREAFEKWAHGERLDVTRIAPDGCEHYPSGETATAWLSWQAARALPAAPAPQEWGSEEQLAEAIADAVSDTDWMNGSTFQIGAIAARVAFAMMARC